MKFKVIVSSTIYYEADIEAESEQDIHVKFFRGEIDFTEWQKHDLDSYIHEIVEVK